MRKTIKQLIKIIYSGTVDKFVNLIRTSYYKEKRKSYGTENEDKTFYVIRRMDSYIGCGLFSHVITTVGRIKYALDHNMIPVVDMMNYPNLYISKKELHKINPWEYYFEQPEGYTMEDVQHSKNVVLGDGSIIEERPDAMQTKEEFNAWKEYMDTYVKLKPEIKKEMDHTWECMFEEKDKVLGVLCRGTDYTSNKPKNHPIQPSIDMVVDKIDSFIRDKNYNKIFLATEDKRIYESLKNIYGKRLLTNEKEFVDYIDGKGIGVFHINRANDNYMKGLEYLTSIYFLSKCNGLIMGQCGGATGAMLFNNVYEDLFLWNLGRY